MKKGETKRDAADDRAIPRIGTFARCATYLQTRVRRAVRREFDVRQ